MRQNSRSVLFSNPTNGSIFASTRRSGSLRLPKTHRPTIQQQLRLDTQAGPARELHIPQDDHLWTQAEIRPLQSIVKPTDAEQVAIAHSVNLVEINATVDAIPSEKTAAFRRSEVFSAHHREDRKGKLSYWLIFSLFKWASTLATATVPNKPNSCRFLSGARGVRSCTCV